MYKQTETNTEISFMESKTGLNSFIICLVSIQFVFHLLASIYSQIIPYFQLTSNLNALNPRLLSSFALDTWLIVFLVSFSVLGYSILKKVKDFSLYLLIVYPAILITLSLVRNVSSLQIILFSLLSCAAILQFSYQKIKQLEYSQV
jgi:hypothetical protein